MNPRDEPGRGGHPDLGTVPCHPSPHAEMRALLEQMSAVNLTALCHHLARPAVADEDAVFRAHVGAFVQHFADCARRFVAVARELEARAATAQGHSPQRVSRGLDPIRPFSTTVDAATTPVSGLSTPERITPPTAPSGERAEPNRIGTPRGEPVEFSTPQPRHVRRTPPRNGPLLEDDQPPDSSPPLPSPAGGPPPPRALSQAMRTPRVWVVDPPPDGRHSALEGPLREVRSGDTIVLQPGVYLENITVAGGIHVELTSAFPGAPVILRSQNNFQPILRIRGPKTRVAVKGVVLVSGEVLPEASLPPRQDSSQPTVPLLSVQHGARLELEGCHVYNGSGGGVTVSGVGSTARMYLCLVSLCGFAGVYAHGGAELEATQCRIKKSECGARVARGARLLLKESTVEDCETDGIIAHNHSSGVVERCAVFNNRGNGVFLSSGADLCVLTSTVELNAMFGVQRCSGATLRLQRTFVRDNGLLPVSDDGMEEEGSGRSGPDRPSAR